MEQMLDLVDLLIVGLGFAAFMAVVAFCMAMDHWMRRVATRKCAPGWRMVPQGPKRAWRAPKDTAWRN